MDQTVLLSQYKLYVELTDRMSQRRLQTNGFYVTLLSGPLAVGLAATGRVDLGLGAEGLIVLGALGLFLCFVWWAHLRSFRQLNSGRFLVIQEMEEQLAYRCFGREWEILAKGRKKERYWRFTVLERWIPVGFGVFYLGLGVIGGMI